MSKRGRPPKDKYSIDKMITAINAYAYNKEKENDIPILKECCYINDWNYDYVMQLQRNNQDLSQSIKKLLMLKEIKLEKGGLMGTYDKTMAVFSLKQLGWKDKIDEEPHKDVLDKLDEIIKSTKDNAGVSND